MGSPVLLRCRPDKDFTNFQLFILYDVNENGYIDFTEMTKVVQSIYMLGRDILASTEFQHPNAHAENSFINLDSNSDGKVTRDELMAYCLKDQNMLTFLDKSG